MKARQEKIGLAQSILDTTHNFCPSWAEFLGMRTNFTHTQTTYPVGPSTGETLAQHGCVKVVYKANFIRTTTTTIFICTLALCEVHCKNIGNQIRVLAAWNNYRG